MRHGRRFRAARRWPCAPRPRLGGRPTDRTSGGLGDGRSHLGLDDAASERGRARTIVYDCNGHDRSIDRPGYDYDALADDPAAVLDALGLTDVMLVVSSEADDEAIRYLSRYGSVRLSRLVRSGAIGQRTIGEGFDW